MGPQPCTCVSKRRFDMTGPLGSRVPAWLHSLWGMYYIIMYYIYFIRFICACGMPSGVAVRPALPICSAFHRFVLLIRLISGILPIRSANFQTAGTHIPN